jgi:predicted membrane channel-forming protein YqfA (hemolysin III family)
MEEEETEYIGTYHEAPYYMQDNEYIFRGYRIRFNTTKKILKSLFMIHNESVNVWSHLIGVGLFIMLIIYTIFYLAPPGLYSEVKSSITHKWLGDFNHAKE